MKSPDRYLSLDQEYIGELKDRGSKFLAYAFEMKSIDDFNQNMERLKKLHLKSRHHCFAYRLNFEDTVFRYSDDGEPSGTAGKPIYGQIQKYELFDIGIIVVRYFGGTKLGTGGLIQAYRGAAELALQNAKFIERELSHKIKLAFDYGRMGEVMKLVKEQNLLIVKKEFEAAPFLLIQTPKSETALAIATLKSKLLKIDLEYVKEETKVEGVSISLLL